MGRRALILREKQFLYCLAHTKEKISIIKGKFRESLRNGSSYKSQTIERSQSIEEYE